MNIHAISMVNFNMRNKENYLRKDSSAKSVKNNNVSANEVLKNMPCYFPVNFTGVNGSDISKVRKLFQYGIPDMYSQRITIDPKILSRWVKGGLFQRPAAEVLNVFKHYPDSFVGNEKDLLGLLAQRVMAHPEMTMKEILQEIRPVYSRILRKEQTPVFHKMWEEFQDMPEIYRYKFENLLSKTERMLNDKPVFIPFSSYEFRYKLAKIAEYVNAGSDIKAKKTMTKLMKESMRFSNTTKAENIEHQKKVLMFINHIRRRSVLRNNEQLKQLYLESYMRLNKDKMVFPFRRKSFIYDVISIIDDYPDEGKKRVIIETAQKLPTSSENFAAFVVKNSVEANEKIGYKLVWPSIATIEHLWPRSCGGGDGYANLGIASAIENSARKSIDFVQQLIKRPNTPVYSQRQFDKLIALHNEGIFDLLRIDPHYIKEYADTLYELSEHSVKIDLSKMVSK